MKTITILGRRWFQRSAGNTYHTVRVMVDGKTVFVSSRTYGYGSQYMQTAEDWLMKNNYIQLARYSNGMTEPIWQYCKDHDIALEYSAIDVARKKDLEVSQ